LKIKETKDNLKSSNFNNVEVLFLNPIRNFLTLYDDYQEERIVFTGEEDFVFSY